ncbi:MAG TPA: VWA domain-containing protein [Candidatus Dormibacteraeota bacterium]|nr:VWA domain-containing protein [Candidatus Dormibacteraeota bacterium]
MNCPRKLLAAILVTGLAAATLPLLWAQQLPLPADKNAAPAPSLQTQNPSGAIHATVSLVVVPVTVKDASGKLVTDLQKNEFRIFEDNIEQPITLFSADAYPLSAAVLIDDDLKRSSADKVQKTLQTIAAGFSPADEVSLWRFDEVPELVSDFITNSGELLTKLQRIDLSSSIPGIGSYTMTNGPRVNTAQPPGPAEIPAEAFGHPNNKHINDAIYAAAEELRGRPHDRRKIIFLISDGQNAKNNTHSYGDTLKLLLSQDISVYAIGVGEANLNRGITFLGNNVLAKYAHSTGGDIFYASSRDALEDLYPRVTEQARYQYTLGYSGAHTDRSVPYHTIEVRVRRPGLTILARDGYYLGDNPE